MFSNWLTTTSTNAPPPDIVLEVGPPPFIRYAAHSALLSAHSGYLRSAIRPEERNYDTPIYLPNVTQDQFSPLLTYMYTGFLDLSIENIFAVLLATHVLHMPRASEICRSFLARTQSEGYLGGAFLANTVASDSVLDKSSGGIKIIRPIASKAAGTGVGFIAPPISTVLLPSPDTPFKSLLQQVSATAQSERERSPVASTSKRHSPISLPVIVPKRKSKKAPQNEMNSAPVFTPVSYPAASREDKQTLLVAKKSTITICDIVEDPIRLDGSSKTIIDIASCDGPVRFRRVLNEAYGRSGTTTASNTKSMERSHHNVATSFHLQMAKTINEQRLQQQSVDDESENSQEINILTLETNSSNEGGAPRPPPPPLPVSTTAKASGSSDELFSCVYCKHTFKSQYCYQKHAKRHINPLSIDDTELVVETVDSGSEKDEKGSSSGGDPGSRNGSAVKREVRPLDMNVQYYPCKTCGSKFPSYYFVHKHRKLCHADVVAEENSSSV